MPVTEAYMDPGDFRVSLGQDAPHLLDPASDEFVGEWGHVVVMGQYVGDPRGFTDAGLLAAARFAGVVFEPEWANGRLTVYGAGLDLHLGDNSNGIGPRLESGFSFSADNLDTALSGMLPDTLTAGSIEASGSYTGSHEDQLAKEAVTALMRTLEAHYRIKPNGSVDAELVGTGNVFVESPTVVVTRINTGSDALWTGIPSTELIARRKGRDYMTRLLIGSEGSNTGVTRSGGTTYYGLTGNAIERVGIDSGSGVDSGDYADYGAGVLADHDVLIEEQIRLDQYQIVPVAGGIDQGTVKPGDVVYVWDPASGFYDDANGPLWFRGEAIAPSTLRIAETEWPLTEGMGVYYRPSAASVTSDDWVDLTPYVEWEATARDARTRVRAFDGDGDAAPCPPC